MKSPSNNNTASVAFLIICIALALLVYVRYNKQFMEKFEEKKKKNSKETGSDICIGGFCMPKYYIEAEIDAMDDKTKKTLIKMLTKEPYI